MRTYGRFFGVVSSDNGLGILSSGGLPIVPSGALPGEQFPDTEPTAVWIEVDTDANGNNDLVWITTLCQCLRLNLDEDPSFANYGIPAIPAAQTGVPPDFYVAQMQKAFAPYFASLTINRVTAANSKKAEYKVNVMTNRGYILNTSVPIPY